MSETVNNFNFPAGTSFRITVVDGHVEIIGDPVSNHTEANTTASTTANAGAGDDCEPMLRRFEEYDDTTRAREVCEAMLDRGWTPRLPQGRGGGESPSAYVRFVFRGSHGRSARLYLNSIALVSASAAVRTLVSGLPSAEVRGRDVYLYHSDARGGSVDQAMTVVEALERWALGE